MNPESHRSHPIHPSSAASSNLPFPFVFDPSYVDPRCPWEPSPPIKIDGVTTHHHVDTFVDNINNAITVYGSAFVKDNLHHCLRGNALRWYSALAKIDKESIQND